MYQTYLPLYTCYFNLQSIVFFSVNINKNPILNSMIQCQQLVEIEQEETRDSEEVVLNNTNKRDRNGKFYRDIC